MILRVLALSGAIFFTPMCLSNRVDVMTLSDVIVYRSNIDYKTAIDYAATIIRESIDKGLDPIMVAAVIQVETKFRNISGNTGTGLMQVVHRYHRDKVKTKADLSDPHKNIAVGTTILANCSDDGRSISKILRCYNGGGHQSYDRLVIAEMKKMTTRMTT